MRTRVQKWGNSLGLRIPKPFAVEIGLEDEAEVDLSVEDGALLIRPMTAWILAELLEQVTDSNLHAELDFGPAVGSETW